MNLTSSKEKNGSKKTFITGIRNWIQLSVFIMTIAIGFQFYIFISQAMNNDPITVPRPVGVEGFLPIGALMGWKLFLLSGTWDIVHPASMVILGYAVLISFLLRKSFCGWFCPVGTLSEWVWKLGKSILGKNYRIPTWIDLPLRSVKYILFGFFGYIITKMTVSEIAAFIESPYYKIADVKMLHFFTRMSMLTAVVIVILIVLSLFFRNFWCRYACPYGALLGIFSLISPTRIHRNPETCINCEQCYQACPFHLPVNTKKQVYSPECSGCMDCVNICPSKNTLELKTSWLKNALKTSQAGLLIVIAFISVVYMAKISGHWKSQIPEHNFRVWLEMIDSPTIQHPSVQFKKE